MCRSSRRSTIANGSADNPAGASGGDATCRSAINGQDLAFKHPTAYMWSTGIQREMPFGFTVDVTYVGRRGLYLQRERNINQLPPGTLQANPGVNIAALASLQGLRRDPHLGERRQLDLQQPADQRRSPLQQGPEGRLRLHAGQLEDNASDKRNVLWNTYDDTSYEGNSSFDRRHVVNIYYIYDLPFFRDQDTLIGKTLLGGWQISGASFFRTGTPFSVTRTNDIAGVGEGSNGQPVDLVGDPLANANQSFSAGNGNDQNFWFNPTAFASPAAGTFGNAPRNLIYNPGQQQWDIALFKNFGLGGPRKIQFRAEMFNFINHAEPERAERRTRPTPTSAASTAKSDDRRDVQLSLRFLF